MNARLFLLRAVQSSATCTSDEAGENKCDNRFYHCNNILFFLHSFISRYHSRYDNYCKDVLETVRITETCNILTTDIDKQRVRRIWASLESEGYHMWRLYCTWENKRRWWWATLVIAIVVVGMYATGNQEN